MVGNTKLCKKKKNYEVIEELKNSENESEAYSYISIFLFKIIINIDIQGLDCHIFSTCRDDFHMHIFCIVI